MPIQFLLFIFLSPILLIFASHLLMRSLPDSLYDIWEKMTKIERTRAWVGAIMGSIGSIWLIADLVAIAIVVCSIVASIIFGDTMPKSSIWYKG